MKYPWPTSLIRELRAETRKETVKKRGKARDTPCGEPAPNPDGVRQSKRQILHRRERRFRYRRSQDGCGLTPSDSDLLTSSPTDRVAIIFITCSRELPSKLEGIAIDALDTTQCSAPRVFRAPRVPSTIQELNEADRSALDLHPSAQLHGVAALKNRIDLVVRHNVTLYTQGRGQGRVVA